MSAAYCPSCGTPTDGSSSCAHCGQRIPDWPAVPGVVPPPPLPPAEQPSPALTPRLEPATGASPQGSRLLGSRGMRVGLGAAVVALLVVIGLVAARQLGGDESDKAPASSKPADDGDKSSTSQSGGSTDSSEGPGETNGVVTCWADATADAADPCPTLTGLRGMRWVFPTMNNRFRTCESARLYDGKITAFHCSVPVASGGAVGVTFSEFGTAGLLATHYESKYGEGRRMGDRRVYGPALIHSTQYQVSAVYADGRRWSMTAAAPTRQLALEGLRTAQMRSIEEMNTEVGPPPP
jgi:hypothetical protein